MRERFRAFWKASEEWGSHNKKHVENFKAYGSADFLKMHDLAEPFLSKHLEENRHPVVEEIVIPKSVDFAFVNEGNKHLLSLYVGKNPLASPEKPWELEEMPAEFHLSLFSSPFGYYATYSDANLALMEFFHWGSLSYLTLGVEGITITNPMEIMVKSGESRPQISIPLIRWEFLSFDELPKSRQVLSSVEIISCLSTILERFKHIEKNIRYETSKDQKVISPLPVYFFNPLEKKLINYGDYLGAFTFHQFSLLEFQSESPSSLVKELVWCALYSEVKGLSPFSPSELMRDPEGPLVRAARLKKPSWLSHSVPLLMSVLKHYVEGYHDYPTVELFGKVFQGPFEGFEDSPEVMLQREWEEAIWLSTKEHFISKKQKKMLESIELFTEQ